VEHILVSLTPPSLALLAPLAPPVKYILGSLTLPLLAVLAPLVKPKMGSLALPSLGVLAPLVKPKMGSLTLPSLGPHHQQAYHETSMPPLGLGDTLPPPDKKRSRASCYLA
jgi:hypothetical protein